jgi:hypothetical protein
MLKMKFFRLGTTNGDKRLGTIIIFLKKIYSPDRVILHLTGDGLKAANKLFNWSGSGLGWNHDSWDTLAKTKVAAQCQKPSRKIKRRFAENKQTTW